MEYAYVEPSKVLRGLSCRFPCIPLYPTIFLTPWLLLLISQSSTSPWQNQPSETALDTSPIFMVSELQNHR